MHLTYRFLLLFNKDLYQFNIQRFSTSDKQFDDTYLQQIKLTVSISGIISSITKPNAA